MKAKEIRQSHTSGADLFKPMYRRVLSVDSEIVVYERVGGPPGTYATYANQDARLLGADIQGRVRVTYVVTAPLEVLETTAADMPLGRASGVGGRGGAQQIHLPPDWGRYVRRR